MAARELEHRLVRLRARVAEEGAVVARDAAELVGQADVLVVVEVVGGVEHAPGLRGDRGGGAGGGRAWGDWGWGSWGAAAPCGPVLAAVLIPLLYAGGRRLANRSRYCLRADRTWL